MSWRATVEWVEVQARFDRYVDMTVVLRTEAGELVRQRYEDMTPGEAMDVLTNYGVVDEPF